WAWTTTLIGVYQPLAWMLLGVQSALWDLDPAGYHAVSLALHALNAVVLCLLITAILRRAQPERAAQSPCTLWIAAALASALFALHPLRTEVVAWASCQPYLPCVLFCLLSVLAYLRAHDGPARRRWLLASWALYAAALLGKAVAVP